MELVIKHFKELTTRELYDILKFRVSIFVVEQNCPYQEIDNLDLDAYHLYLSDNSNIIAYLRVFKYSLAASAIAVTTIIMTEVGILGTNIILMFKV